MTTSKYFSNLNLRFENDFSVFLNKDQCLTFLNLHEFSHLFWYCHLISCSNLACPYNLSHMISMVRSIRIICNQDNQDYQDKSYIIVCSSESVMSKFTHESRTKDTLSEHEQIIKAQLEQWIDDLQKEADLNSRLEEAFKNDKSHIKSLSQM